MTAKQAAGLGTLAFFLYHLVTFAMDEERWQVNRRRYQANPNRANLIRLLVAEGVLIKDIGFLL